MMKAKIKIISLVLFLVLTSVLYAGADNLLVNPAFASTDGHIPNQWNGAGKEAYRTENGTVRISGRTSDYAAYLSQAVKIEPGKSYYFSVEMKSDRLTYSAAIWYSVMDSNNKCLADSTPLLRHYTGPQKEWVRIGFVIPAEHLPAAKTLSVSMAVYNPSRQPGDDRAIYFRNPELTLYDGQKNMPPPKPAPPDAGEEMSSDPFSHHFINYPLGTPYLLEKGGVGFFRMDSKIMPRRDVTLRVEAPEGVRAELYMWDAGVNQCVRVSGEDKCFRIGTKYRWLIWGNALIFKAAETVPEQFEITLILECGAKTIRYAVPVKQIPRFDGTHLPETMRYNSWQSFPVTRIDLNNPENRLAKALSDYWIQSGWKHTPFVEIVRTIPYDWKEDGLDCRQAVSVSGSPVPLYCDSSLAAAGPDYYRNVMEKKGLVERIAKAECVMWDYEPYVKGPVSMSCFCTECRKKFADEFHLPENLSGEEILRDHKTLWTKFRCRQRAEVVRTVVAGIKQINPNASFLLCTMPIAPDRDKEEEYNAEYGIQHDLYENFVDVFASMNYWSNLDMYRSLEREMLELKKEKRTLLSNGWDPPKKGVRTAMNLLAAGFCGEMHPSFFQGLFLSNGEQIRELRRVMNFIAATEGRWRQGTFVRNTREIREGFNAAGNYYALERKADDGRSWSLIFNNSTQDTLFLGVKCVPSETGSVADLASGNVLPVRDGEATVKLEPLTYLLLEFSPERKEPSAGLPDRAEEERLAREAYEKMTSSGEKNGMHYSVTPEACALVTPSQTLELDLKNSGEAVWKVGNETAALTLGRDIFMDKGVFSLSGRTVRIEEIVPEQDAIRIRFSYTVTEAPYDGLEPRREYVLSRDEPLIECSEEIVPAGGYRPFRLRTVANFVMPGNSTPGEPVSEVTAGGLTDRGLSHASFVREGALFPDGKPFFSGRHFRDYRKLEGNLFILRPASGASYRIEMRAENVDQLFIWRERQSATLELIWPDAYPDNDPHKVATWKTKYSLKMIKE